MKQKKSEKKSSSKHRSKDSSRDNSDGESHHSGGSNSPALTKIQNIPFPDEEEDLGIRVKNNLPPAAPKQEWTLSGREAEAIHFEEEDEDEEEEEEEADKRSRPSEGLRNLLSSG